MEKFVFIEYKKDFWTIFKIFRSYIFTDIAPTILFFCLLYAAYIEYCEYNNFNTTTLYVIACMVILVYMTYRIWKLYRRIICPKIQSITIEEKGICVEYNKSPYRIETCWADIESINYFPGELDEGLAASVEYFAYVDIYAIFKDQRNNKFKYVLRILNEDWWNEQDETVYSAIVKLGKVNVNII